MRHGWVWTALTVLTVVVVASGQYRNTLPSGNPEDYLRGKTNFGIKGIQGLIDPARLHMSHMMSFGYASVGGRGVTQGLYMNTMDYQIAQPLWLTTHLGYRFQPSGPAEWNPAANGTDFVGGADLNWRPTSNTTFRFSFYRNMSPYGYDSDFGRGPYDYRPYMYRP